MRYFLIALLFSLAIAGSAQAVGNSFPTADNQLEDESADGTPPNDPLESFNRPVFHFNVALDKYAMRPVANTYHELPQIVRLSVSNELTNISEPLNMVHGVLRLNPRVFFTSFWRFVLNTTVGLGGLRDFAGENGLHNMDQSLDNTLGRWGISTGPYLVLPLLGPSSIRGAVGTGGDFFLDPVSYFLTWPEVFGIGAVRGISERDSKRKIIDQLYYESLDPYVALRSVYLQHEQFNATKKEPWQWEK